MSGVYDARGHEAERLAIETVSRRLPIRACQFYLIGPEMDGSTTAATWMDR